MLGGRSESESESVVSEAWARLKVSGDWSTVYARSTDAFEGLYAGRVIVKFGHGGECRATIYITVTLKSSAGAVRCR